MKPASTSKPLFDAARVKAALDAAPDAAVLDEDAPPTTAADWHGAVKTVDRAQLQAHLKRRVRGAGKKPASEQISLRLPPDVLARWRATGRGWQTRMAQLVATHAP